ncbi:GYD domain-containing protein [Bauldia sp.]|uniref:GYD domain-containing protein n=1 Tax=Bauldia sp. TaxID=2575872 RepID=UPI003BA93738
MIFVTQGRYTEHAMAGMLERPEDRRSVFLQLLADADVRLIADYWTMGEYDFVIIVEAKDEKTWMNVLLLTAATGGVCDLRTSVAISPEDGEASFEAARKLRSSFRPAGEPE